MEKAKNTRVQLHLAPELMEKVKYLHQKEGLINRVTKNRVSFSSYISNILWEHVNERMAIIKGLRDTTWDERDFDD